MLQAASKILKVLSGGKIKLLSESSGDNLPALTMNESSSNSVKVIKPSRLVHCSTLTHVLFTCGLEFNDILSQFPFHYSNIFTENCIL